MKLELVTGCICDSLTADGIQEVDMTNEQRQEVINRIAEWLNPKDLNYLLQALLPQFGEYECDDKPCSCCGDYVEKYTLEI